MRRLAGAAVVVDTALARHTLSPHIYGRNGEVLSSSELLVSTTAKGVVRVTNGKRISAVTAGSRR